MNNRQGQTGSGANPNASTDQNQVNPDPSIEAVHRPQYSSATSITTGSESNMETNAVGNNSDINLELSIGLPPMGPQNQSTGSTSAVNGEPEHIGEDQQAAVNNIISGNRAMSSQLKRRSTEHREFEKEESSRGSQSKRQAVASHNSEANNDNNVNTPMPLLPPTTQTQSSQTNNNTNLQQITTATTSPNHINRGDLLQVQLPATNHTDPFSSLLEIGANFLQQRTASTAPSSRQLFFYSQSMGRENVESASQRHQQEGGSNVEQRPPSTVDSAEQQPPPPRPLSPMPDPNLMRPMMNRQDLTFVDYAVMVDLAVSEHEGQDSDEEQESGLTEEEIMNHIKREKFELVGEVTPENKEVCSICQEDYVNGDEIGKLDCGHRFHLDCIKQWLVDKNECPLCRRKGLLVDEVDDKDGE